MVNFVEETKVTSPYSAKEDDDDVEHSELKAGQKWVSATKLVQKTRTRRKAGVRRRQGETVGFFDGIHKTKKRVGVPGGRQLNTRATARELCCHLKGSILKVAVSTYWSTSAHMATWAIFCTVATSLYDEAISEDAKHSTLDKAAFSRLSIDGSLVSALTFLITFVIARYLGFVISRYNERFNFCCKTNGHMTHISIVSAAAMPGEPEMALLLMRYSNLLLHLYYMLIDGGMTDAKWEMLLYRGLLKPHEKEALMTVEKKPAHVCWWAMRLVYKLQEAGKLTEFQANELKAHIGGVRGSAKQIAYQLTPMPVPFFHFCMVGVHLYLLIQEWNSARRWAIAYRESPENLVPVGFETLGALLVVLFFNTARKIAVIMTNPFGDDEIDYELDFDLRGLWSESLDVVSAMGERAARDEAAEPDLAEQMLEASGVHARLRLESQHDGQLAA